MQQILQLRPFVKFLLVVINPCGYSLIQRFLRFYGASFIDELLKGIRQPINMLLIPLIDSAHRWTKQNRPSA
jgi:hypothetical protein